ncbi:MAG: hypothetical protein ABIP51_10865 [Bacteroidia bacterium]
MKLASYIFLFSILFSLFARLEVCISYLINQEYYAEVLCENKDEEDSCCMGKCAMEKELTKLAEKEEEQPTKTPDSNIKLNKAEEAVVKTIKFYSPNIFLSLINTSFEAKLKEGKVTALFKPPTI